MSQFSGLAGIAAILIVTYLLSNNKNRINWRLVICGLCLQLILALFILKTPIGQTLFQIMGQAVERLLGFASVGTGLLLGPLADSSAMAEVFGPAGEFILVIQLIPTIIFVAALSSLAYHLGIMQKVVKVISYVIFHTMGASGAETTSNAASVMVGQVEAQILIKPFLATATKSELLAIMAGSMACISGGIMAVYIQMGIAADFMIAASIMAIPGALVLSKILYPETETSMTQGQVDVVVEHDSVNMIDAIAQGAMDGLKVGVAVCTVLIAVLAMIGLVDYCLGKFGLLLIDWFFDTSSTPIFLMIDFSNLNLTSILGAMFYYVAMLLGVPVQDAATIGSLLGTKIIATEFVAFTKLAPMIINEALAPKSIVIATFALCGFAGLASMAMIIGGVGGLVPERRHDLAALGFKAMFCGTLASYMSAAIAGIIYGSHDVATDSSTFWPVVIMMLATAVIISFNYADVIKLKFQTTVFR